MGHLGEPDELAAVFETATSVTGDFLPVDGGLSLGGSAQVVPVSYRTSAVNISAPSSTSTSDVPRGFGSRAASRSVQRLATIERIAEAAHTTQLASNAK